MDFTFQPLSNWPGERTKNRKRATFSARWDTTLRELDMELRHLTARQVIVEADCEGSEINIRTGMLKSSARLRSPGIVLSFTSKYGPLRYPCDTFHEWQDNLRAIVLFMSNQRANARYGVGRVEQNYTGYKALPGGAPITAGEWATVEAAATELCRLAGHVPPYCPKPLLDNPEDLKRTYANAARRWHPDLHGGDGSTMAKVNRARDFIEQHSRPAA